MVKNPPANAGDAGDGGSLPDSGGSPGGGNGNTLYYCMCAKPLQSCLTLCDPMNYI